MPGAYSTKKSSAGFGSGKKVEQQQPKGSIGNTGLEGTFLYSYLFVKLLILVSYKTL